MSERDKETAVTDVDEGTDTMGSFDDASTDDTVEAAGETSLEGSDSDQSDEEDTLSEFVQQFAKPISKSDPCGENVRYDQNFETVKSEIDELSENNYQLIADLSTQLLTEKTKDVLVGSYLAFALTKKDGLSGFVEGIGVLGVITEQFWESLFPERMTARQNALAFFTQKVMDALEGYKPTEAEKVTARQAIRRFDEFQKFIMDAMGDKAPALSGIKQVLEDLERRLPKPKVKAASKPKSQGEGPTDDVPGPPAELNSASDASMAVTKASTFYRTSDPTNPIPYRVLRALRWSAIVAAPPNETGKTKIPAPLEQRRTYLTSLLATDDAKKLLEESEASFQEGSFHFWIDLQLLTAGALEKLGPTWENARHSVLEETALLLKRVPELTELTFVDGTPFVSPLCAEWIETEVLRLLGSGETSGSVGRGAPTDDNHLDDQKKAAQKLLQKGDLAGAIKLMREGGEKDRSAKESFERQLHLADLCIKGKRPSIARSILEKLDQTIEQHGLAEWEPDLALTAWSSLHTCYLTMNAKASSSDKTALVKSTTDIFEKICRIDAAYALTLPQG
ncbi:MAG: type VI secretion system protein TssA [Rhodothermia bacterium]|nr:MAG: type VI secretion system protein TssA [Rhodothermia bacterium]